MQRARYEVHSDTPGTTVIYGVLSIAADASVVAASTFAPGGAWTKTGTGEYTFTLTDAIPSNTTFKPTVTCTLLAATAVNLVPQTKSIDLTSSAKTWVVRLNAVATPTNPSAVCQLHYQIIVPNTSQT